MDRCPECDGHELDRVSRRQFVQTVGATAAAASALTAFPGTARAADQSKADQAKAPPETMVKKLYDTLTPQQKEDICFDWDYRDDRGLLRMHVANNWQITEHPIAGDFFSKEQQDIIEALFWGLYNPDWHDRIRKQLKDDADGYGKHQSIAIFGQPGSGKFEFVMTGRHLTIRCDGDSAENVAFGGPIFYGHAAQGFNEKADHPGNVFWFQAQKANALYQMLDGKQRAQALISEAPKEQQVQFRKAEERSGIPVSELSRDQRDHVRQVLTTLIEPYRTGDREEAVRCLNAQGGLDKCRLAFYQSGDIGDDKVWDIWRLEGPAFVWHFRGAPHVHVWVNVASDPNVKIYT